MTIVYSTDYSRKKKKKEKAFQLVCMHVQERMQLP